MKHFLQRLLAVILFILLLEIQITPVFNAKDLSKREIYSNSKSWTINFSHPIDISSINSDSVYILNEYGIKHPIEYSFIDNATSIIISPLKDYNSNEYYYLYLTEKIASETNINLDQKVVLPFILKQDIETSDYDKIYNIIKYSLKTGESKIDLSKFILTFTSDEIFDIIEKVLNQNPDILYYKQCIYYSNGELVLEYSKDKETINKHNNKLEQKVKAIISNNITTEMTDYEKVRTIHDYIINNASYDFNNYINNSIPDESYSAYGVLINGTGVCESYTEAFQLILNQLGIYCIRATGTGNGEAHAWNIVKLEDEYYHIDVTWDDPVMKDGSNILSYSYFNVTDDEIKQSHTWNTEDYPECNSEKYNYYTYNNLVVSDYDEFYTKISYVLKNQLNEIEFKIKNHDENTYNIKNAVSTYYSLNPHNYNGITWSYSLNQNVLSINFNYQ